MNADSSKFNQAFQFEGPLSVAVLASNEARELHEMGVIHAVVSAPAEGIATAAAMGMRTGLIGTREDLRLIYAACDVVHPYGKHNVFRLARRALVEALWWNNEMHPNCRGPKWSTASLAAFFVAFADFPSPMQAIAIREHVRGLIDIHNRQVDAEDHLLAAQRLLGVAA